MNPIPHIQNGNGTISLMLDGTMKPIDTAHKYYDQIKEALKNQNWAVIPDLVNIEKQVNTAIERSTAYGNVVIENGEVLYKGTPVHGTLVDRIVEMARDGFDIGFMALFLDNLMQNPSYRAVQELYDFLAAGGIPITENGTFLGYKKINADWTDIYTGKIDNSIGSVCEMPRNMVDEDSDRTCSAGLHVCSYDYLPHFGSSAGCRVVVVEVNPADVVAIPKDYNNTKMRVCRYTVVREVEDYKAEDVLAQTPVVNTDEGPDTPEAPLVSPDDYKSIGKAVTKALDDGNLDTVELEDAATRCGLNGYDAEELGEIAYEDTKRTGKKVAKYLKDGIIDAPMFVAELHYSIGDDILLPEPTAQVPEVDEPEEDVAEGAMKFILTMRNRMNDLKQDSETGLSAKEVGKEVTASLELGDIEPEGLVNVLYESGIEDSTMLDEFKEIASNDPKRVGKKVAKLIGYGDLKSNEVMANLRRIEKEEPIDLNDVDPEDPVPSTDKCYRCSSTDIDPNTGECGNCGYYN